MLCFTILILLLPTCFSESPSENQVPTGRIVGGWTASVSEYPFILSLEGRNMRGYSQFCGAAIIGNIWALTAAHCFIGVSSLWQIFLRSGSSFRERNGEIHQISAVIKHPWYNGRNGYDIAIIKVSNPFRFSNVVKPIRLAHNTPSAGTAVLVIGWGALITGGRKPHQLQQVIVNVMNHRVCSQRYRGTQHITPHMICANSPQGGKGPCHGDSGGPLLAGRELVGIVSWGGVCGDHYQPAVYTDVAFFRRWITHVTRIQ